MTLEKNGRKITGTLLELFIFGTGAPAEIELKRNVFNSDIEGVFTTTIVYSGEVYDLDGTTDMVANF